MSQSTRTITGKSTVPAGTAGTGAATANPEDNSWVDVAGGDITELTKFTDNSYRNVWIYFAQQHVVAKLKGVTELTGIYDYRMHFDEDFPFLLSSSFTIIVGDLIQFSVKNDTAVAGSYDGQNLAGNSTFEEDIQYDPTENPVYKDVKTVDATGTSFVISESR